MTPGPPAAEDVFGQLATTRVIPVVVLGDSAAAAPLAGALSDAGLPRAEITLRTAAGEAANGDSRPGPADTPTARKGEVDNLVAGAGARADR